ncbi:cutinase family protein [Nocardia macrotermitis]
MAPGYRIRSYCDTGDPFCDSGKNFPIHLTYLLHYGNDATRFVVAIGG